MQANKPVNTLSGNRIESPASQVGSEKTAVNFFAPHAKHWMAFRSKAT